MQERPMRLPVMLVSLFAQDDELFARHIEKHLNQLRQEGFLSQWYAHALPTGEQGAPELEKHMRAAALILLFISPSFLASAYCAGSDMHQALQRHQRGEALVLPILPNCCRWEGVPALCDWQRAPFGPLPSFPWYASNDGWGTPEVFFQAVARHLRQVLLPYGRDGFFNRFSISAQRVHRDRTRLLRRLQDCSPDLILDPLQSPWLVPDATLSQYQVPAGSSVLQMYHEAQHSLLILGEPGCGKSTVLWTLAHHLVEQAKQDVCSPLPVVLPLSSWAAKQQPLLLWMGEQFSLRYRVSLDLATQWLEAEQMVPLLDGLDEMDEAARLACIQAINAYHFNGLRPLVVCSRRFEYTAASEHERLALLCAVEVQPLSPAQVEATLADGGEPLAALRVAFRERIVLQELVTTPLILHLLILTYQGVEVGDLPDEANLMLQHLLAHFAERMLHHQRETLRFSSEHTRSWLRWLARQMRANEQQVIFLKRLPAWVLPRRQRSLYAWCVGLFWDLIVGLPLGLFLTLTIWPPMVLLGPLLLLPIGLAAGRGAWRGAHSDATNVMRYPLLLRFWLWQARIFPWQAADFLEEARTRHLLQRVGQEGYRFAHPLLLDLFAERENADIPSSERATQAISLRASHTEDARSRQEITLDVSFPHRKPRLTDQPHQ